MEIRRLCLYTPHVQAQQRFYTQTLGLPLLQASKKGFSVQAGFSILEFRQSEAECIYHFAFNIPSFMTMEAQAWVSERVDLLTHEGDTIIDFPNWNAEAMYFLDPAGNIAEFIARRNLEIPSSPAFSPQDILCVSEIGIAVPEPETLLADLHHKGQLKTYWSKGNAFWAVGGEEGLVILVDSQDWTWLPTDKKAKPQPLQLEYSEQGQTYELHLDAQGRATIRRPLIL